MNQIEPRSVCHRNTFSMALKWTGDNLVEMKEFLEVSDDDISKTFVKDPDGSAVLYITGNRCVYTAELNDWIVKTIIPHYDVVRTDSGFDKELKTKKIFTVLDTEEFVYNFILEEMYR